MFTYVVVAFSQSGHLVYNFETLPFCCSI